MAFTLTFFTIEEKNLRTQIMISFLHFGSLRGIRVSDTESLDSPQNEHFRKLHLIEVKIDWALW